MKSLPGLALSLLTGSFVAAFLPGASSAQGPETANSVRSGGPERFGGIADRVNFRGGVLFAEHGTVARVDSETLGVGTLVDLENDLGLETKTRNARLDGYVRLGRRHTVRGGFISLQRGSDIRLQRQIQWGDEVFALDVGVRSSVELVLVPAAYRFAVLKTERADIGLSIGVFAAFADAAVAAPTAAIDESQSLDFPLPVLGADFDVAIAPGLFLLGGLDYFGLSVSGVDGSWRELRGGVEYFPLRNLGVGAAYRHVSLEVDGTQGLSAGSGTEIFLDYRFYGPQAYLTVAF